MYLSELRCRHHHDHNNYNHRQHTKTAHTTTNMADIKIGNNNYLNSYAGISRVQQFNGKIYYFLFICLCRRRTKPSKICNVTINKTRQANEQQQKIDWNKMYNKGKWFFCTVILYAFSVIIFLFLPYFSFNCCGDGLFSVFIRII